MDGVRKVSWIELVVLFGIPTVLNTIACQLAIPYIVQKDVMPIEAAYFLSVGLLVLVPMFFGALYLGGRDIGTYRVRELLARMRVKRLTFTDTLWTVGTFITLVAASYLIAKVLMPKFGMNATPFFFQNMPLKDEHMWILYIWPLFFFFNIFGEEFLWRGYIQPRQELLNGSSTWLVHGLLWACWHLPMGIDLIIASLPIFFILPAVVQARKNTTIAIVVHVVFGAFGFLAISLGAVH